MYMYISPWGVILHTGIEPHLVTNVLNNHPSDWEVTIGKNIQDKR